MYTATIQLIKQTYTRLRHLPFATRSASHFDVADAHEPTARARLGELLSEHASLAGQTHALSRDRWRVLFTSGRRAAIPFHLSAFTIIAWRDPVGPAGTSDETFAALRAYGAHTGKQVIVLAASDGARASAASLGFASVWLGGEQRFDLRRFSTRGRAGEKLRLAVNHARRKSLTVREIRPDSDAVMRERIQRIEHAWKRARLQRETRSFLRTDPLENAAMRRYFVAEREEAGSMRAEAFLVCAPVSARGWYLQDLVRHPGAPRGAAELVSLGALEAFTSEGSEFATMGIVPFFDAARSGEAAPLTGATAACVRYFERAFRFEGLQRFRAKFPATNVAAVHALLWPGLLSPLAAWDITQLLR